MIEWVNLHPQIREGARQRFEACHFSDSVNFSITALNDFAKQYIFRVYGIELDGADLFRRIFSLRNPYLIFRNTGDETSRNIQEGYLQIFAGTWIGIRNPKAHQNLNVDPVESLEMIIIVSHLFRMLDKAINNNKIPISHLNSRILKSLSRNDFLYLNDLDNRRWVIFENTIHHIHDGGAYEMIMKLNKNLGDPTKVDLSKISNIKPGPELISS